MSAGGRTDEALWQHNRAECFFIGLQPGQEWGRLFLWLSGVDDDWNTFSNISVINLSCPSSQIIRRWTEFKLYAIQPNPTCGRGVLWKRILKDRSLHFPMFSNHLPRWSTEEFRDRQLHAQHDFGDGDVTCSWHKTLHNNISDWIHWKRCCLAVFSFSVFF